MRAARRARLSAQNIDIDNLREIVTALRSYD